MISSFIETQTNINDFCFVIYVKRVLRIIYDDLIQGTALMRKLTLFRMFSEHITKIRSRHQLNRENCRVHIILVATLVLMCLVKMKFYAIFVLLIVSLSKTNGFLCQNFNENEKTLRRYCEHYRSSLPTCMNLVSLQPSDVLRLKIEGCSPSAIADISAEFPDINTLDISYSRYRSLNFSCDFKNLEALDASYNELSTISRGILQSSPELKSLDLTRNYLTKISTTDFEHVSKLETLNLSDNALESIDGDVFSHLTELKVIKLNNNRLSGIPIFPNNENLQEIHVIDNPQITKFNCTFMSSMSNVAVYLSWKHIVSFHGDQDCDGKLFRIVQNTQFEGIVPTSDGKYEFHCNDQSFKSLQQFVAGHDAFENVEELLILFNPTVWKIDLSGNHIGELNATFERFRNLRELSLSDTDLEDFDFSVLNVKNQQYLTHLDISQNKLKNVTNPYLLQYFGSLYQFNASGNQIENTNELIQHLQSPLQKLDLSGNVVKNLSPSTFGKFISLRELSLCGTNLSIPEINPFQALRSLSVLDISHNNLSNVNFVVLKNTLDQLQNFSAADCQIQDGTEVLKYLGPFVKNIDLSGNNVGHLNDESFDGLANLSDLKLSNTGLTSFDSSIFENSSALSNLDISNNQLKEIDLEPIALNLKRLNLEGNDLEKIEHLNRTLFPALTSLAISQNELSCDFLEQIQQDFKDIQFDGDLFEQKDGHCHSNLALIIGIVIVVILAILLIICVYCVCRKRFCREYA